MLFSHVEPTRWEEALICIYEDDAKLTLAFLSSKQKRIKNKQTFTTHYKTMYNPKYIYIADSRKTYQLTSEGEAFFRERFPTSSDKDMVKELGCSCATLYKLAAAYGVKRDPMHKRDMLRRVMLNARSYYVSDKAQNPERYQELFLKRGQRICRQRRAEELRIMSGEEPRYRFRFAPAYSKKLRYTRKWLRHLGYIPYDSRGSFVWYFAPETKRSLRVERRAKEYGLKFVCFR